MRIQQAIDLAAWVNTHDDGTPQPRATVVPVAMPDSAPWSYRVDIRSTVYNSDPEAFPDALGVQTEQAHSLTGARLILGY